MRVTRTRAAQRKSAQERVVRRVVGVSDWCMDPHQHSTPRQRLNIAASVADDLRSTDGKCARSVIWLFKSRIVAGPLMGCCHVDEPGIDLDSEPWPAINLKSVESH